MKILYCASFGGHWVQLKKIASLIDSEENCFITTKEDIEGCLPYHIADFNINEVMTGLRQLPKAIRIVKTVQPDLIVTTGAAPGFLILLAGFILRKKTIWIDSIANSKKLSLSCRAACFFSNRVLTQWPELATRRVKYIGRLL